ncbi:amino acid adenylation domain-containing protein [Streptomyces sp. NPDC006482]|uniref:amino acid adenylation domain-containing protein n=1 Tax=Streptomyces sp. NPDC006482 TaxID=3154306 RepID=UPI0033A5DEB7
MPFDKPVASAPAAVRLPLSVAQRDIWTAHLLDPTGIKYNVGECREIQGPVDPELMAAAWRRLVDESDFLRVQRFEDDGEQVWQLLDADAGERTLAFTDLSGAVDPEGAAWDLIDALISAPFDLTGEAPVRCALIKLAEDRFFYFYGFHHLVVDGVGVSMALARLVELYERAVAGEPWGDTPFGTLAELLAEDAAYRASEEAAADRAAWRAHLADAPDAPAGLVRGRDRAPSAHGELPFARRSVPVSPADAERLRTVARAARVSWSVLLVALFAAYLQRVTGRQELMIALPVTGRTTRAARSTPGMMSNVVPLRLRVRPEDRLADLVRTVSTEVKHGLRHQRTRYEDLGREAGVIDGTRRLATPVLNIMGFHAELTVGGHPTVNHNVSNGPVDDLSVAVLDLGPAHGLRIDFDTPVQEVDPALVTAHQDRFTAFVTRYLAENGDTHQSATVADLALLDDDERALLTGAWAGPVAQPVETTLVARFEEQVRLHADRPALIDAAGTVTYAELNASANHLARELRDGGLGRGAMAGILLERGIPFATALLAVLKTGAGHVLLDPDFPEERLRSAATDAGITHLVTTPALAARADGPWTVTHAGRRPGPDAVADDLGVPISPDDPACLMFTSGSTGRPKAILSSHRNLVATLIGQPYLPTGPDEVYLQCSPVSWDAFSLEFWGPLLHGGSAVLQPGQKPEPTLVTELSRRHGVTTLLLSATLFNFLVDEHPEAFETVTTAFTVGEAASPAHVHKLQRLKPGITVLNGYGPAEVMIFATTHTVEPGEHPHPAIPVGTPLVNKPAYVLDARLELCPPGVTGELYVAGDGLAHGYLGRPDLTATRFVPDPIGTTPGGRLYRTGDLARFDADGRIVYEGRADDQIKIRGFRIEPGETEAVLLSHPRVTQAVVTVHEHRLAAYLVTDGEDAPDPEAIRGHVAERLPEHLVPTYVTVLDRLPVTPNGKIDKRALPAPAALLTARRAPRNETEEVLTALYGLTLDKAPDTIGIDDSFFHHGGHSLLAARLTNRVAEVLGVRLTIRDVFGRPTPAGLAELIAERGGAAPGTVALPVLVPGEGDGELVPASYAQRRLWLLAQLDGGSAAYNVPTVVRFGGAGLDVAVLEAALNDVVERHAPLRTVFEAVDGEPFQRVLAPERARLAVEERRVDAEGLDAGLAEVAGRVFDLASEIPVRATLFRLDDDAAVLALVLHHVATDGLSNGVFFADLERAYAARAAGEGSVLEPLTVRYADYAAWQRRVLGAADSSESLLGRELDFWRQSLAGLPEGHGLTLDRSRPVRASHRGGQVELDLGADLFRRAKLLAEAEGCSPFMVVHAALVAALSRLGAGADLAIGSPVAGRSDEALNGLVGFFVNTLVLRTDSSGDPSFRELLGRVRTADLDAFAHQEAPFDLVLEALNPTRTLSRHPLFQICLTLESGADATKPLALPGVAPAPMEKITSGSAKFDLEFFLRSDDEHGLRATVLFAADLFDEESVRRVTSVLGQVLHHALAEPGAALSALEVLASEERELLTGPWAGSKVPGVAEGSLVGRFEEQVARVPERTALVDGERRISYAELNVSANRLAHHLVEQGLGRGDMAGVLLDRGGDFAIAVLAVTKTGAGYTLLDPEFPDERLRAAAADAGIGLLVTDADRAAAGRVDGPWETVVCAPDELADLPGGNLGTVPTGDDVACVMFTSGSTGRPKGILSSHRNLVSTVSGQSYGRFGEGEVFLQCSPVSWDAFSLEFWGALLHGGTTVLQPGQRPEPVLVDELSRRHGVTMLQLSASLFNFLVDEHPGAFDTVTVAYTGGEAASPAHVRKLQRLKPGIEVVNGYGPAESMGFTTTHALDDGDAEETAVPIGTPLVNKGAYVLDPYLNLCPPGVTGELYLTGDGLAHGYLGRPDLTATRFVPDPIGTTPGGRLYRTGDLARFDREGRLVYEGRVDDQIKIRGFRVEPGETEAVLLSHPQVTQAVVTVYDERLAAYLVVEGEGVAPEDIRRHAADRLPEHLVPSHVTVLDRLPLTPNGKIDKRALPAPAALSSGGRAPRTPLEETVLDLFTRTLDTDTTLTIDDDFFHHGGHSLLAARLTNRVAEVLGVRLTIRDVFGRPTPAGLAELIAESGGGGATGSGLLPALVPGEGDGELVPASYAQRRLWLLAQLDGGSAAYNVPTVVRFDGAGLDVAALEAALNDVVERHAPLRTVFEAVDGEPFQRVLAPERARLAVEQRWVDADGLDAGLAEVAGRVFDLASEIPVRATLFRLDDDAAVLALVLHHVATDGLSNGVFFADLERAYAARAAGEAPGLEPLTVRYADYAAWQRRVLGPADSSESLLGRELGYWRQSLAGLPENHGLTLDHPRPLTASHRGGEIALDLGPHVFEGITALARAEGCSPFMVVHAALVAALSRLGAGADLAIGSPVAGRSDEVLNGLVGFFVNTLVLRTDSSGDPSFRELLGRVRTADLDAFAHQEAPFDLVLEALNPTRTLSRHPLFQICLGLDLGAVPELDLPGVTTAVSGAGNGSAKFDLEFLLRSDDRRGLHGAVLYAADLFEADTVRRMGDVLGRVLEQVLADPGRPLSALEVLASEERELLTGSWAGSKVPGVAEGSLVGRFEEQVARVPERTALVDGERRISYAELNVSANRLARHLVEQGLGRGDMAGVLLDRGGDFAIAVLAVLKTGAAYTLLDPDFPDERLRSGAADAGIAHLVTSPALAGRVSGPWAVTHAADRPTDAAADDLGVPLGPDDPACLMFTSGSTGRPKGILSSHRNLVSTVSGQSYGRFGEGEVFLQCSPVSWDAFSLEFWGALLHGGTTVLQPGQRPEPVLVDELSRRHGVTMLQLSASLFNFLVDEHPGAFDTVTVAYTGGEAASPAHVHKLQSLRPGIEVVNGYGPAESMGFTTTHLIRPGDRPHTLVPIGVPLLNKGAYVLDPSLNLCPPGVTGELYLTGDGLAHGYLGRPDLTATRFVPDPYGPPGTRLYRTGDLVRFDRDGRLVYEGRADDQIKIRGFRVEPGETEAALFTHPQVTQAVVTVHDERLAAYLVVEGEGVAPEDIRRHAADRLPEHLVPSHVTVLDRLPLTPNGKIDKRALPAPAALSSGGRAPRTPLEETVLDLFTRTLDTDTALTIDDDFFHHGGHSLLGARLTNHIAGALDVRLTVRDVFQHPTPARLAAHIDSLRTAPARKARPALRRRNETDRISS